MQTLSPVDQARALMPGSLLATLKGPCISKAPTSLSVVFEARRVLLQGILFLQDVDLVIVQMLANNVNMLAVPRIPATIFGVSITLQRGDYPIRQLCNAFEVVLANVGSESRVAEIELYGSLESE